MALPSFSRAFRPWRPGTASERRPHTRRSRRCILDLEAVEGRTLLSTLFVSTTGSIGGRTAYPTIQAAVNSNPPSGSTIEVAPGPIRGPS